MKGLVPSKGLLKDVVAATAGMTLTQVFGANVDAMIARTGLSANGKKWASRAGKVAVAMGLGMAGKKFVNAKVGQMLAIGGLIGIAAEIYTSEVTKLTGGVKGYAEVEAYPVHDLGSYAEREAFPISTISGGAGAITPPFGMGVGRFASNFV